jgi:hypothetical protein
VHGGAVHRRVSDTAGKLMAGRFLKIWARPAFPPVKTINSHFKTRRLAAGFIHAKL